MSNERTTARPAGLTDAMLDYLDELRKNDVNTFYVSSYFADRFGIADVDTAQKYVQYWHMTYGSRHRVPTE